MAEAATNRIRHLREDRGWSIRELADRAGVDFNTVHRLETGATRLDLDKMRRISRPLGVRPSALLLDEDVEFRADEIGEEIIRELSGIAPDDRPDVLQMARELVRVVRNTAAQRSAGALGGEERQVSALADLWNHFDHTDRDRAIALLAAAGGRAR